MTINNLWQKAQRAARVVAATATLAACTIFMPLNTHAQRNQDPETIFQRIPEPPKPDHATQQMLLRLSQEAPRPALATGQAEICNNNIDDDNDGWIDNLDGDCTGMVPLECDGSLYQTFNPGGIWGFYNVQTSPVLFSLVQQLTGQITPFSGINSIAFNPVDRYIYGINPGSPFQLYRIDNTGDIQLIGNITGLPNNSFAGCMDFNGNYYITGGHSQLYVVNIFTRTATFIGTHGINAADIAFSPQDQQLYGWDGGTRRLYRINPATAAATPVGPSDNRIGGVGALYFNAQGDIIAYGDNITITATQQEQLFKVDPATGIVTLLGTGPNVSGNDGCSCSFGLEMTKQASVATATAGSTFSYTFTLFNEGFTTLNGMAFTDALPAGLTFASEPYATSGLTIGATAITGTTSAAFQVSGLAPNSTGTFTIDVTVSPTLACPGAILSNQASLGNLPAFFGGNVLSDDPTTGAITDPTIVTVPGDRAAPLITCPPGITIPCGSSTDPAATGSATATDNCGAPTITYSDQSTPGACAQQSTITRTWTATDAAGNTSSCTQTIHITDTQAPIIGSCPPSVNVQCLADVPAPGIATGTDNCDPAPVSTYAIISDNGAAGCAGSPRTIVRVYTLRDACGNGSTCTQTIQLEAQPIQISGTVTNVTCFGASDGAIDLSATGSCGPLSYAWSNGATTEDLAAIGGGTYTVTVSNTGGCSATATYTVGESAPLSITTSPDAIVFPAWADSACTTLSATVTGGSGTYTATWTAGSPTGPVVGTGTSITVCPAATTTYHITVTDSYGCTATGQVTVCAIDIRCTDRTNNGLHGNGQSGNGVNMSPNAMTHIAICHVPPGNPGNAMTHCIPVGSAGSHIGQHSMDRLGACSLTRDCGSNKQEIGATISVPITATPNPFTHATSLRFTLPADAHATLTIHDPAGRLIQQQDLGQVPAHQQQDIQVGQANWASGIYIIQVTTSTGLRLQAKAIRQ